MKQAYVNKCFFSFLFRKFKLKGLEVNIACNTSLQTFSEFLPRVWNIFFIGVV